MRLARKLFHYTGGASLLSIIDGSSIWATRIQYMNDSKEFIHAIDLANHHLSAISKEFTYKDIDLICNRVKELLNRISNLSIYVACFSEEGDSLSQWRGYCPPSFGYSIGFNIDALKEQAKSQYFELRQCIYLENEKNKKISVWVRDLLNILVNTHSPHQDIEKTFWEYESGALQEFISMASVMKHSSFADEKEWRLIALVPSDDKRVGLRAGKSMLVPYCPITLDYTKENGLLWSLYIGPTPQMDLALSSATQLFNKAYFTNGITHTQIPYRDW